MDEVYYKKGDTIIEQDDFGDTFFVIEEGIVSIRVGFELFELSYLQNLKV